MSHSIALLALDLTWTTLGAVLAGMAAGIAIVHTAITFARRPRLTLDADDNETWTRVESDGCVYVRELVRCAGWTRGAKGARVMLESYQPKGAPAAPGETLGGTPSLGWSSAQDGTDGSLTVHPGATRTITLGALTRGPHRGGLVGGIGGGDLPGQDDRWYLHMTFADTPHGPFVVPDERDVLPPGEWTIRLLVVADDAKTRRYDVDITWDGDAHDARDVLDTLAVDVDKA